LNRLSLFLRSVKTNTPYPDTKKTEAPQTSCVCLRGGRPSRVRMGSVGQDFKSRGGVCGSTYDSGEVVRITLKKIHRQLEKNGTASGGSGPGGRGLRELRTCCFLRPVTPLLSKRDGWRNMTQKKRDYNIHTSILCRPSFLQAQADRIPARITSEIRLYLHQSTAYVHQKPSELTEERSGTG